MRKRNLSPMLAALTAVALMMSAACTDHAGGEVYGDGEALNMSTAALSAGHIDYLSGYYMSCQHRDDEDRWSIQIGGAEAPLPSLRLAVVHGDSACDLHLDQVVVSGATHRPAAVMQLGASYAAASTAFALSGTGDTIFYANARLDPADFSDDFKIMFAYSADLEGVEEIKQQDNLEVRQARFHGVAVQAPNYNLSLANLEIASYAGYIQIVTGTANLSGASVEGQKYAVWDHATPAGALDTYHAVDTLWNGLTPHGTASGAFAIDAAEFTLVDQLIAALGSKRTIIVQNLSEGVPAYQVFTITFENPEQVLVDSSSEFKTTLAEPAIDTIIFAGGALTIVNGNDNYQGQGKEIQTVYGDLTVNSNYNTFSGFTLVGDIVDSGVGNDWTGIDVVANSPGGSMTFTGTGGPCADLSDVYVQNDVTVAGGASAILTDCTVGRDLIVVGPGSSATATGGTAITGNVDVASGGTARLEGDSTVDGTRNGWSSADHGDNSYFVIHEESYQLHTEGTEASPGLLAALSATDQTDFTIQARVQIAAGDFSLAYLMMRTNLTNMNSYICGASSSGTHLWFGKMLNGVYTAIDFSTTPSVNYDRTDFRLRCEISGTTLKAMVWNSGEPEPTTWQAEAVDTDFAGPGKAGFAVATYPALVWNTVQAAFSEVSITDN